MSFLGPSFIGTIAYKDLGNIGTNTHAGLQFFNLLRIVVFANLVAMFVSSALVKVSVS
jgi:Mn2+/Fe2+ NRAMP family transporter